MSTTTIRATKVSGKTLYNASDVFKTLGLYWGGQDSMVNIKPSYYKVVKSSSTTGKGKTSTSWHYALTDKGVEQLCKKHKKANPLPYIKVEDTSNVSQERELAKVKEDLRQLKMIFGSAIMGDKSLPNKDKNATILTGTLRDQIRTLTTEHAQSKAKELGVTKSKDMGMFFDLSFNLLYNTFAKTNKIDIKRMADAQGISGLQVAEDLGLLYELRDTAKQLFA